MLEQYMLQAIELAKKGVKTCSPNPCVGAVVVRKGKIVGNGYHKKAGFDHAEIVALKSLARPELAKGSTMYVTLEPCSHQGATPPCCDAILAAGISKVVVGMKDPNPKVFGRGISFLQRHSIDVEIVRRNTDLGKNIRFLNQAFIKYITTPLPYVTLKAGVSLDGCIATSSGESKWITGAAARKHAAVERLIAGCVLVGSGTVIADNPSLNGVFRVVLDAALDTDPLSKVYRDSNVTVLCSDLALVKNRKKFNDAGIDVVSFSGKRVSILRVLKYLRKAGFAHVFVEGGSGVFGSFYDSVLKNSSIIDRVLIYQAPFFIGGKNALSVVGGTGLKSLKKSLFLKNTSVEKMGEDYLFSGYFNLY